MPRGQQERVARETLAELARGAAGAVPRDELPHVGAQSHRARLRLPRSTPAGNVLFTVYDPNDPAEPGRVDLRPGRAPLRGEPALRHRAGAHPRLPHVLLGAALGRWRASPPRPTGTRTGSTASPTTGSPPPPRPRCRAPRACASRAASAGCSRAPLPAERRAVRSNLARVLAGAPPARARRAGARDLRQLRRVLRRSADAQSPPRHRSPRLRGVRRGRASPRRGHRGRAGRGPAHRAPRQLGVRGAAPRPPAAAAPPTWCSPPSRTRRSSATCASTARSSAS